MTDDATAAASGGGAVQVSVVLPAYNEAETLETTVKTTLETLSGFLQVGEFEVIVAEDGCEDRTPEIAKRLSAADSRVRHVHSEERLGRGAALETAFRAATGDTLVYFDTDLATDMRHLEPLVESVRTGEYDVATGSRYMPDSDVDRPFERGVPSLAFNGLVRLFLGSDVRDHQCGFKAFDREVLFSLLDDVEDDHWFWDTEVLVRAQRAGYDVLELPVDWTPKGDTSVDLVRDVIGMGGQLLRTWWQVAVEPRFTRPVRVAAGGLITVVALALMTLYIDPSDVAAALGQGDPGLVALAGVVYLASWVLRGDRYRVILRELGYPSRLGVLTGAIFISQTGNLVFPARAGDAIRAYVVNKRRGVPYSTGVASLSVERLFDLLTLVGLAGVMVAVLGTEARADLVSAASSAGPAGRTALLVTGVVAFAAGILVTSIVLTAQSESTLVTDLVARLSSDSYADRLSATLTQFAGDVQRFATSPAETGRIGGVSVGIWAIDVLVAVIVLVSMGVGDVSAWLVGVAFLAVSVGNLAKVLPLSPGGIGLYEAAFTMLIVALTPVGAAVAFGAAVLDHMVKNLVTIVGGATSMLVLNVSLTRAVDESPATSAASSPARDGPSGQD